MSALTTRTAFLTRRLATAAAATKPTVGSNTLPAAFFTTTAPRPKSAVDAAKDTLKTVDRTVSDKLVDGIDIGSAVADKIKKTTADITNSSNPTATAKGKASEVAGQASQMAGEARGKVGEMAGEAKGKASEVAGEARGKASEVAGEARGKANEVAGKAGEVAGKARGAKEDVKGHAKGAAGDVKKTVS